ncbi:hypothetical protein BCR43DRAFT_484371 [Syncephalastrum racemosum]|uniref:Uncharacterized protein n=1 Tax=Syncephalastrum racemosum TaxID=13706 RepID=A0A1X2HWN5_SYNRA|nr:hypothetical protein BCR43DRAFT_484371 [Syncephalastrum racemosum]
MRFVLLSLLLATLVLFALSAPTAPIAGGNQAAPSKEDNSVQLQDTGSLNRRQDTGKIGAMGAALEGLTTGGGAKKSLPTGGGAKKKGGILGGHLVPGIL